MTETAPADEQLALVPAAVRAAARRRSPRPPAGLAQVDPVAEVLVDVPLAHLDRPFEYAVPESMSRSARPGVRVRVRFAGQDLDGFVVARKPVAAHAGRLTPLRRVVSAEPVLDPALLALCRAVADRCVGALPDVLRLAVPARHAEAEKAAGTPALRAPARPPAGPWQDYPAGPAFLDRLHAGEVPRAAWAALPPRGPDDDWPAAVAVAVATTLAAGRGAVVVVPDHRDVARVDAALTSLMGAGRHVVLTADLGPRARYAGWLRAARGQVGAVVGTRGAMFAPVHDLGLVVCWDDGDDLHADPHAPYPHVRDVLVLRAELAGAAALLGGHARTPEVEWLIETGWARPVDPDRAATRRRTPRVVLAGEGAEPERDPAAASARLPSLAWRTARAALREGPVLVQVPRRGYVPAVACQQCRAPGRCDRCHGPLAVAGRDAAPTCRWCGADHADWVCPHCQGHRLRSLVVGAGRTAEELGRAFPGVPVRTSHAGSVLATVPSSPALVIATPGAEPVADGGFAAALLLDGWALLDRADLRAGEEALRRWLNAAALVRGASAGGVVALVAPAGLPPVEALLRWSPQWHAARELGERVTLGFPPAAAVLTLTGTAVAVEALVAASDLPVDVERLGPVPAVAVRHEPAPLVLGGEPVVRLLLRTRPDDAARLSAAVRRGASVRSARKDPGTVKVHRDPLELV